MTPDVFWISGPWKGRLAIVARPRGWDWIEDEASAWRAAGIDRIVSLLEPAEERQLGLCDEQHAVEDKGISFVSFPIPDLGVPPSLPEAVRLLTELATALERGQNVGIHCRQSIGRSGLMAVSLLMFAGLDVDDAIRIVSSARGVPVPETAEQRRWVDQLPAFCTL